jgi:hypothetical protein
VKHESSLLEKLFSLLKRISFLTETCWIPYWKINFPYWKIAEAQKLHRCVPPLSIMLLSIMIDSDKVGGVSNMQPTLSEDVPYAYHDHEAAARQTAEVSS